MTKKLRDIKRRLRNAKLMENRAEALEKQADKIRQTAAKALAPCAVGDLIEGGTYKKEQGVVTTISGRRSNSCIIHYRALNAKGKVLRAVRVFNDRTTVKVIAKGPFQLEMGKAPIPVK